MKAPIEIVSFAVRNAGLELFEPDLGRSVGGGAPVAARRQGAARGDLRSVGQGRAFELAEFKEAVKEDAQPPLDLGEGVGALCRFRNIGRPMAPAGVAPGVP